MRLGPSPLEDHGRRGDNVKIAPELRSKGTMRLQRAHGEPYAAQNEQYQQNWSKTPPPRPSREGTPSLDLDDTLEPLHGTRTRIVLDRDVPSTERPVGTSMGRTALGRFPSNASSTSTRPSRMPSPNPVVTNPLRPGRGEYPKLQALPLVETNVGGTRSAKDPSPLSASSSKSASRFGLFTKRTKSPLDTAAYETPEKAAKKGPAAGTGHEGYGKYSKRGRSGSISTNASRGRSTSTNSAGRTPVSRKSSFTSRDDHEMDEFLRERLAPVVMTGGSRTTDVRTLGSAHQPTSSGESLAAMASSESPRAKGEPLSHQIQTGREISGMEPVSVHHLRRDHRRLPNRKENQQYPSEQQREGHADSSYSEPTLAARRSVHRSQLLGKQLEVINIPSPIDTRSVAASSSLDCHDGLQSSLVRTDSPLHSRDDILEERKDYWLQAQDAQIPARSSSPSKRAFARTVQASPTKIGEGAALLHSTDQGGFRELPATVSSLPESRSIAFYALLDGSEQESSNEAGVVQAIQSDQHDTAYDMVPASVGIQDHSPQQYHRLSTLLPSPPTLTAEFPDFRGPLSPSVVLRPPEPTAAASEIGPIPIPEPKKPRLQQVGRIPRVVSKRDRPHIPPPQSFSRPFARRPTLANEAPTTDPELRAQNYVDRPLLGIQTGAIPSDHSGDVDSAKPPSAPVKTRESFYGVDKNEFLTFPPRIGSEVSGSSSSGILSPVGTTAIVPEPGTAPDEDEVWNEYNEFLDTVESPAPLAEESKGPPERTLRKKGWAPQPLHIRKESSRTGSSSSTEKKVPLTFLGISAPPKTLPNPPESSESRSVGPTVIPKAISDPLVKYGYQNIFGAINKRLSLSSGSRYSTSSIDESDTESFAGRENKEKKRITPPIAGKTDTGRVSQSTLRFDALMTSRWLSFDKVLFSPALVEARRSHKTRVLVLDGLGNDDWSFYCAETYVDVEIYNLTSRPASSPQIGALELPKNYHQAQHVDLRGQFPFDTGFFTAVVLRFPAAMSEDAYRNSITECMRVLRPGGYLEMSILDIDMVNMGHRAKRALRELKYRMGVSQPDVTLKPLSDSLQMMVKHIGFKNLNRCMVNVPVAGHVSRSRSRPGSSDEDSGMLGDLRMEASDKGGGGLAKSLAMVGRWWFTKCYEMIQLPYGDLERSIWNDEALLEECEKRGTGFKLLLCYAQKPADPSSQSGSTSKTTEDVRSRS